MSLGEPSVPRKETKTLSGVHKAGFESAEGRVRGVQKNGQDEGWAGREEVTKRAGEKSHLTR